MRKFRYGDPKSTTARNRVIGQVVKFLIGWNILGYIAWQHMKNKARDLDPNFDNKKTGEQLLSMFGYKDTKMTPVRIKIGLDGFKVRKMDANGDENVNDNSNHGNTDNNSSTDNNKSKSTTNDKQENR